MTTKQISCLMCSTLVMAAKLTGQVGAQAPPQPDFGLMGGALGQTLRLNVLNRPQPAGFPPDPCHVIVGFKGILGATVGSVQELNLAPGQAAVAELNFNNLVSRVGQRVQVRPVVAAVSDGSATACRTSAEIYDQLTARTMAYAAQFIPDVIAVPPPVDGFGLIGGAVGQTMRLNVLYPPGPTLPPGPTRITLGFDIPGFPPGPTRTVDLMPGEGAFLDLPMDGFTSRLGQRIEVRPRVIAPGNIRVTAEVYDQVTGRTTTFVLPPPQPD